MIFSHRVVGKIKGENAAEELRTVLGTKRVLSNVSCYLL